MPQVSSNDGTTIAYEKSGAGPALILIDGAMSHRAYHGGGPLAAALAREFTVVHYDRRGRGDSGDTQAYAVEREIEDIAALIGTVTTPVHLYGFSSGAVLALRAAAALGTKVKKLAVLEPPFNGDDEASKREFVEFGNRMSALLADQQRGGAVEFFLKDMLPPEVLDGMKRTPDWKVMEGVAHTLGYDVAVMGPDGAVPAAIAAAVKVPVLVLAGSESPPFKHDAAAALARALPNAECRILKDQMTRVPPEVLAPVLLAFFRQVYSRGDLSPRKTP